MECAPHPASTVMLSDFVELSGSGQIPNKKTPANSLFWISCIRKWVVVPSFLQAEWKYYWYSNARRFSRKYQRENLHMGLSTGKKNKASLKTFPGTLLSPVQNFTPGMVKYRNPQWQIWGGVKLLECSPLCGGLTYVNSERKNCWKVSQNTMDWSKKCQIILQKLKEKILLLYKLLI